MQATENAVTSEPSAAKKRKPYCAIKQPLAAAIIPGAELKIATYCEFYGVSEATALRRIKAGDVQVVRYGKRCTRIVVPA